MDCSQPGSSIHGFFQASVLKWVVISYSRGSSQPRDRTHVSYVSFVGRRILNHCATWEVSRNYVGLVFFTSGTWLYNKAQFKSLCLLRSSSSMRHVLDMAFLPSSQGGALLHLWVELGTLEHWDMVGVSWMAAPGGDSDPYCAGGCLVRRF